MPRKVKRKSNLDRHSASANASRESDDSREERLERVRAGDENRRKNETDVRREVRLKGARARQTTTREK